MWEAWALPFSLLEHKMNKHLTILQLNMGRSLVAFHSLVVLLETMQVDVLLLQEPAFDFLETRSPIPGYQLFTTGKWTSTLIRQGISVSKVLSDGPNILSVVLDGVGGQLGISNVYLNHTSGEGIQEWEHHCDLLTRGQSFYLAGGDINGRSSWWGSMESETNQVGSLVENFILARDLAILNTQDSRPTFFPYAGGSPAWLDATFCSQNLLAYVEEWDSVPTYEWGSDHRGIVTKLDFRVQCHDFIEVRNFAATDWDGLNSELAQHDWLSEIVGSVDKDEFSRAAESLCNSWLALYQEFTPLKRIRLGSKPWWTPALKVARRKFQAAKRKWQREGSDTRKEEYLQLRRDYRHQVKRAKDTAWLSFCSMTRSEDMWNLLAKSSRPKRIAIPRLVEDGVAPLDMTIDQPDLEKAKILAGTLFPSTLPPSSMDTSEFERATLDRLGPPSELRLDELITLPEVKFVIKNLQNRKAPGIDRLPGEFFKNTKSIIAPVLVELYNKSLSFSFLPEFWKTAKVVPVPKTAMPSSDPKRYRPISLLPVVSKILESVVKIRLMGFLESGPGSLSPLQMGFRRNRDTILALWETLDALVASQRLRHPSILVALDITKAYDMVWIPGLISKLLDKNVPHYLVRWIHGFTYSRRYEVTVGKAHFPRTCFFGLPQGSPLSPALFLVFLDDLLHLLQDRAGEVAAKAFADDLLIWASGPSIDRLEEIINEALELIGEWSTRWRLSFNTSKCEVLEVSRRTKRRSLHICLNQVRLREVPSIRYLGVLINSRLTWTDHVAHALSSGKAWLNQVRRLARKTFGCHQTVLDKLVRACFLPKIFYASEIWVGACASQASCARLDSLLANACVFKEGLYSSTSVNSALVWGNIFPADLFMKFKLGCYFFRELCKGRDLLASSTEPSAWFISPLDILRAEHRRWMRHEDLAELEREIRHRDSLAPDARRSRKTIIRDFKANLQEYYEQLWRMTWHNSQTGSHLREVYPTVAASYDTEWRADISRSLLAKTGQFATGHGDLPAYTCTFRSNSSKCWFCDALGTRNHVLWECPELLDLRVAAAARANITWDEEGLQSLEGHGALIEFVRLLYIRRAEIDP